MIHTLQAKKTVHPGVSWSSFFRLVKIKISYEMCSDPGLYRMGNATLSLVLILTNWKGERHELPGWASFLAYIVSVDGGVGTGRVHSACKEALYHSV